MRIRLLSAICLGGLWSAAALPGQLLSEGFEDVSALEAGGWRFDNQSSPLGTTDWFQGNPDIFEAQDGSRDSYLGANFANTDPIGTISNWALTPVLPLIEGDELVFWTRVASNPTDFPDRLLVTLSTAAASAVVGEGPSAVGEFDTVLLTLNETLTDEDTDYPAVWTQYAAVVPALGKPGTMGRFGFHYHVDDGGIGGSNSDYLGIDTVSYASSGVFFDDFEVGDATTWSDVEQPIAAAGYYQLFDNVGYDFLAGFVEPWNGDLYFLAENVVCDGGPATWGNNLGQGDGRFLNDLPGPLAGFQAPESGYSGQYVCLHLGGVYVYQLETPAGLHAYFRVVGLDAESMTMDYEVR